MKFKYFYQQFFSHMSIIIIAFLVLSFLFTHYVEDLVYQNKADELISYGKAMIKDLKRTPEAQNQVINQYSNVLEARNISFSIFDPERHLYAIGRPQPTIRGLTESDWDQITKGKTIVVKSDYTRYGLGGVTFVVVPYLDNGKFVGGILLTSPISVSSAMIHQINRILLYMIFIALGVSILLSWILSRIHVKRIKRLREATSLVSAGNYHVKVNSSNFDEIGELANDFNQMVDKLNTQMEEIDSLENRRRKFMSDVSHEMRTPLTTISGVIEGLKNGMISEEDKARGINLVSHEAKRLIRLVNENLDYDKIRSNQIQLFREDIQVLEVLEIIQEQLSLQADEKNDQIIVDVLPELIVNADYDRLIQILINITKNSIQFTENGTIYLRGRRGENETIIEIEDTGIGIDPTEVKKSGVVFIKRIFPEQAIHMGNLDWDFQS